MGRLIATSSVVWVGDILGRAAAAGITRRGYRACPDNVTAATVRDAVDHPAGVTCPRRHVEDAWFWGKRMVPAPIDGEESGDDRSLQSRG